MLERRGRLLWRRIDGDGGLVNLWVGLYVSRFVGRVVGSLHLIEQRGGYYV